MLPSQSFTCCKVRDIQFFLSQPHVGTSREAANKIAQTGFAALSKLDSGYFGTGIYFTSDVRYAQFYSQAASKSSNNLCFVLAAVCPGNVYPVTEAHDGENSLRGKPAQSGYQSHYTNVVSKNGDKFGHVCNPPTADNYDELVVFQDVQALPLFVIECSPN